METLLPGDVVIVRTPSSNWLERTESFLIRLGAALRGEDDLENHVAVVHHTDGHGTTWAIEGRPGGVGWTDISSYDNPYFLSNAAQPKTIEQRAKVYKAAEGLLGVAYDWTAIGMDAAEALGLGDLWTNGPWDGKPPAHLVCSALAAWVYRDANLPCPATPWRTTTPADWAEWVLRKGWQ